MPIMHVLSIVKIEPYKLAPFKAADVNTRLNLFITL